MVVAAAAAAVASSSDKRRFARHMEAPCGMCSSSRPRRYRLYSDCQDGWAGKTSPGVEVEPWPSSDFDAAWSLVSSLVVLISNRLYLRSD